LEKSIQSANKRLKSGMKSVLLLVIVIVALVALVAGDLEPLPPRGELKRCVMDEVYNISKGRPEFDGWVQDVDETIDHLIEARHRCEIMPPGNLQNLCGQAWNATLLAEINRLRLALMNLDFAAGEDFQREFLRCFRVII